MTMQGIGRALRLAQASSSLQSPSVGCNALLKRALQSEAPTTNAASDTAPAAFVGDVVGASSTADGETLKSSSSFLGGFQLPAVAPKTVDSTPKKVYARLSNSPKYAFKTDMLTYFDGCNLKPHQLVTIFDEKYRQRYVQIEFDNMEAFRQAQRIIVRRGRLGGRYMKLDVDAKTDVDDIHKSVKDFRGQSLVMMQLPTDATAEDVERFFQGYNLASLSTRFLRVWKDVIPKKTTSYPPLVERRALVKFASPLEALRALRMKQGQFCLDRAIELRFVQ